MVDQTQNVQPVNVQPLDIIESSKVMRFVQRTRKVAMNIWTGSFAAEETVITVEPNNAGH
jgi:hypothetical protein